MLITLEHNLVILKVLDTNTSAHSGITKLHRWANVRRVVPRTTPAHVPNTAEKRSAILCAQSKIALRNRLSLNLRLMKGLRSVQIEVVIVIKPKVRAFPTFFVAFSGPLPYLCVAYHTWMGLGEIR